MVICLWCNTPPQINTKAYGISDSVSTRDGYNDVNATFLEYGGRGNLDKNADFTLTDKGKEDFATVILQFTNTFPDQVVFEEIVPQASVSELS